MAKDTTPQELFKQALAVTTKAMSADRDVEVGYGNEPAPMPSASCCGRRR